MNNEVLEESRSDTKGCAYPGCPNTILANSGYEMCEVCRVLSLRNSITITLDPSSPINSRRNEITARMIHNMRPEEILRLVQNVEFMYLELQKTLKSNQLEVYRRVKFQEATDEVTNERHKPKAPKAVAKKQTNKAKLSALLGDEETARELLGGDFSDL